MLGSLRSAEDATGAGGQGHASRPSRPMRSRVALHLMLPLWAVLTSLIVTQMSVGRSLKATRDYMLGTVGGAIYGGAIAVLIPHSGEGWIAGAAGAGGCAAGVHRRHQSQPERRHGDGRDRAAGPGHEPRQSAGFRDRSRHRGHRRRASPGLLVSFPGAAVAGASARSASTRRGCSNCWRRRSPNCSAGLTRGLDNDALHRIQDGIGAALVEPACDRRGSRARARGAAVVGPDTGPLLRTILRLRHDVVMIGRASVVPLPADVQARLARPLSDVSECDRHLYACRRPRHCEAAAALRTIWPVDAALQDYAAEVAALRSEGLIRGLPVDVAERFFALGFPLEQMRQNLNDLDRCRADWCGKPADGGRCEG